MVSVWLRAALHAWLSQHACALLPFVFQTLLGSIPGPGSGPSKYNRSAAMAPARPRTVEQSGIGGRPDTLAPRQSLVRWYVGSGRHMGAHGLPDGAAAPGQVKCCRLQPPANSPHMVPCTCMCCVAMWCCHAWCHVSPHWLLQHSERQLAGHAQSAAWE